VDDAPPSLERDFVIPALGEEPLLVVAKAIDPSGATVRSLFHLVPVPACSVESCAPACCLESGLCGDCPVEPEDELIEESAEEDDLAEHADDPIDEQPDEAFDQTSEYAEGNPIDTLEQGDQEQLEPPRSGDDCSCSVQRRSHFPLWALGFLALPWLRRQRR
jgi:MYXO-CTERM domain-containing protein